MKNYLYPAFFTPGDHGSYGAEFPDLPGCFSAGDDLENALTMAREALGLHLYGLLEDGDPVPAASAPEGLTVPEGTFLGLIEGRPDLIGEKIRNSAVKKTLTIPKWMNEEAERQGLNFSQILQDALRERIQG